MHCVSTTLITNPLSLTHNNHDNNDNHDNHDNDDNPFLNSPLPMQIITLELENLNLYSPSTGEVLCHEDSGTNEEARSLMGYWTRELMDEPFIKNPELQQAWDAYMEESDARLEAGDEFPGPDVDEFLEACEQPSWIAFRIETWGLPGDIAWFVVDMEANSKENQD